MSAGNVIQAVYIGPSTSIPTFQWDDGSGNRTGEVILTDGLGNALLGQQLAASSIPVVLTAAQITALTPPTTVAVTAASLPLPTGAATASAQGIGNTSIASIDGKTPSLGQALAAASVPVVLTAAQITTLTPPTTVAVTGTFWQATQPISASALPLPTGASTEATLSTLNGKVPSLGQALAAASVPVVLTAAQLSTLTPLTTVAVTGTFWQATQPVSASSLPLPTGASTEATLSTLNGKVPSLGQALAAASVPVVLTAAQIITLTPPTSVGVTNLPTTLDTNSGNKSASTIRVVLATDQPLPAGAAIIGKVTTDQTTHGTTDLVAADITKVAGSAIATGNGTAAGSIRVCLASDSTGIVDTELPAAAALSDTLSNPTTPQLGCNLLAWDGTQWTRIRTPNTYKDLSALSITTLATTWTPTSTKKFRLMGGSISVSAAASVVFEDNAAGSGVIYRTPKLVADSPFNFDLPGGRISAFANNVLKATSSAAASITGTLWGTEE